MPHDDADQMAWGDGPSVCPPMLEQVRCRECGRDESAHPHSPMALASCCYAHVPQSPTPLRCPITCFSDN